MPSKKEEGFRSTFKIGADPELCLSERGGDMHAGAILERHKVPRRGETGEVGTDGNSSTGEIRPKPANSPKEMTENIGKLIERMHAKMPSVTVSTRNTRITLGGHIHIEKTEGEAFGREPLTYKMGIMESLWHIVALGDHPETLATRLRGGYGNATDWRQQPHGWEFRVPSSEWLTTPMTCAGTLAIVSIVWQAMTDDLPGFKKLAQKNGLRILKENESMAALQALSTSKEMSFMLTSLHRAWHKTLKQLKGYEEYKEAIELVMSPRRNRKAKEAVRYDMAVGWGLKSGPVKVPKKRVTAQLKGDAPEDDVRDLKPAFNPDMNVSAFANDLAMRFLKFNWETRNPVFLFGMHKEFGSGVLLFDRSADLIERGCENLTEKGAAKAALTVPKMAMTGHSAVRGRENSGNVVLVGIPYSMRVKLSERGFREVAAAVWDADNRRLKHVKYNDALAKRKEAEAKAKGKDEKSEAKEESADGAVTAAKAGKEATCAE